MAKLLMIPGPINFDHEVIRALSKTCQSHVAPEFISIFGDALKKLREVFISENGQPFVIAGSGTLAMEMAATNVIQRGEKALVVNNGVFGERFVDIFKAHGIKVDQIKIEWGRAADPTEIREKLESDNYKVITVTHVDTSTGIANNIEAIGNVTKEFDTIFIVDAVCSLAGQRLYHDKYHVDLCLTSSQKALGVPPGLAILNFNQKALDAHAKLKQPVECYYTSIANWLPIMQAYERGDPSYFATPPVNLIYALHESVNQILREGMEARFKRHEKLAAIMRKGLAELGFKLGPEEEWAANTMSAVYYSNGIEDGVFRSQLAQNDVIVAGGLGKLKGKIFRVGHMGSINENDVAATLNAVRRTIEALQEKTIAVVSRVQ
jgi:alanine-glyoxylate transaminase/serine-glyoxylate transaminase/serine-pyruvate transaminase